MWAEARKQEKKLRGLMVDHKRRAERRREHYERTRADPTQFLQAHGRPCKIHLDPAVAALADAPAAIMPWQGNKDVMIDRFDGRGHLDLITEYSGSQQAPKLTMECRETNYERYRIIIQNDFLKIGEEKFLRTIDLEERFGEKTYQQQKAKEDKKKCEKGKAAIGFNYDDPGSAPLPMQPQQTQTQTPLTTKDGDPGSDGGGGGSDSDSDLDLDATVDIMALGAPQQEEINDVGRAYGLDKEDFIKYFARDIEEQEELKAAKAEEEEKTALTGKKSRRERRLIRDRRLLGRPMSPPCYATSGAAAPAPEPSSSDDELGVGDNGGRVEYITCFGDAAAADSDANANGAAKKKKAQGRSRLKRVRRGAAPKSPNVPPAIIGPRLPDGGSARQSRRRSSSPDGGSARQSRPRRSSSPDRPGSKGAAAATSTAATAKPRSVSPSDRNVSAVAFVAVADRAAAAAAGCGRGLRRSAGSRAAARLSGGALKEADHRYP